MGLVVMAGRFLLAKTCKIAYALVDDFFVPARRGAVAGTKCNRTKPLYELP
jgi:hypothetical protein